MPFLVLHIVPLFLVELDELPLLLVGHAGCVVGGAFDEASG